MRKEILDRITDLIIPGIDVENRRYPPIRSSPAERTKVDSGTTVMAFHFNEGVFFAGDRKEISDRYDISSQEIVKVHQVAEFTGFCFAGLVSDGEFVKRTLQEVNLSFISRFGRPLSLKGQANFAANFCRDFYFNNYGLLEARFILGGIDEFGSHIFLIGEDGYNRSQEYCSVGSGSVQALTVLDEKRKLIVRRSLDLIAAVNLASRALIRSGYRDLGTSDARVALPVMAVVIGKGFGYVNPIKIKKSLISLIKLEESGFGIQRKRR